MIILIFLRQLKHIYTIKMNTEKSVLYSATYLHIENKSVEKKIENNKQQDLFEIG